MAEVTLAVLPVFLLIFLGTLLFRGGLLHRDFWAAAERLTYWLLFPSLIVSTLAGARLSAGEVVPMLAAIDGAILLMTLLALALRAVLGMSGPELGAFVQGVIRMNTYLGLAVTHALFGPEGLASAAVAVAAIVPLVNLLCVWVLVRWGERTARAGADLLGQLLRNPLIVACVIGIGLNLSGVGMPPVLGPMLEILGRSALALGLLAVGAALDFGALRRGGLSLGVSAGLKLLVLPVLTALGAKALGVEGTALGVAVLFNALPTASTAYVLARQLGGDYRLMAAMITAQTALSVLTIPIVLGYLAAA
jgi:predicted permease